jgi:hypothetical protein
MPHAPHLNHCSRSDSLTHQATGRADRNRMAASVVSAIDQQAANARGAHISEGDFLAARDGSGHVPRSHRLAQTGKPREVVVLVTMFTRRRLLKNP